MGDGELGSLGKRVRRPPTNFADKSHDLEQERLEALRQGNPNNPKRQKTDSVDHEVNIAAVPGRTELLRLNNGDTLHLYFVAMGQGDCTVLVTPDNKIFVIDIGTTSEITLVEDLQNYANHDSSIRWLHTLLMQPQIFGIDSQAEGLIFTHSDQDHSNVSWLLNRLGITFKRTYFTDAPASYRVAARGGSMNAYDAMQATRETPELFRVNRVSYTTSSNNPTPIPNLNVFRGSRATVAQSQAPVQQYRAFRNLDREINDIPEGPQEATESDYEEVEETFTPYHLEGQGLVIYDDENGFSIRLLTADYRNCGIAAFMAQPGGSDDVAPGVAYNNLWRERYDTFTTHNIEQIRESGEDANSASSIVHIRYAIPGTGNIENYLICGDATIAPLQMVMREYIFEGGVTLLQIPHHGSESFGSNDQAFVNWVNPQIAVCSSPYHSIAHHHPRRGSLQNFERNTLRTYDVDAHTSYGYWFHNGINWQYENRLDQPYRIYVTGWMRAGYYHYTAPFDTATNRPDAAAFRDEYVPPPPVVVLPPLGGVPMVDI